MPTRAPAIGSTRPAKVSPVTKKGDPFYQSKAWRATRAHVLARDRFRCTTVHAGERCSAKATTVHHVKERSAGGSDEPGNLVSVCARCHNEAHPNRAKRKAWR